MSRQGPKLIPGRLSVHRDGFGFLIPDTPVPGVDGDIFLPPDAAAKAMHGDRVAVKLVRLGRDGRSEGDIVKILDRAHNSIAGTFRVKRRGFWVEPHDARIGQWVSIPPKMAIPRDAAQVDRIGARGHQIAEPEDLDGMIVNAEVVEFGEDGAPPIGRVIEILGHPDDFGVDVELIIRKFHIPHRFPPDVIEQAQSVPLTVDPTGRRDFREFEIVTIDGETARDFDDAVWAAKLENGNYALQVHIADVSHYVRPGSPIDREAAVRGTSVYFPDRAVPMLPLELSTGICSLKPKVDRLVMSALLEIDHRGDIVSQEFCRGVIHSVERMTYTAVHAVLEGDPSMRTRYAPLAPRFELMKELALLLNRKRVRRGSIDFDLPEPLIEFDDLGEMTGIRKSPRNIAHRIVEEFMLAANEAVAHHITAAGAPMVYRIHEEPDPKKVVEFEEIASQFGASLGVTAPSRRIRFTSKHRDGRKSAGHMDIAGSEIHIGPRHYQRLIAKIEGTPLERILSYLMLRSLRQARYSAENQGHFALASECYCHFTSPIRRYPDLLVHRALGALLDGHSPPYDEARLNELAARSSQTERTAADAERELVEWKKVKFMADHVGGEFGALIISTTKYGFFVELEEFFVEGLVPIDTLPGDRYGYHENTRRIVGARTRREFRIGEAIRVRLDRIDGVERKLQFSLAVPPEGKRKSKSWR